jgi:hypothetical protein
MTMSDTIKRAMRTVWRMKLYIFPAVLALAVSSGLVTAALAVARAALRPNLGVSGADNLVFVWSRNPELAQKIGIDGPLPVSAAEFGDLVQTVPSLQGTALFTDASFTAEGGDEPTAITGVKCSPSFFDVLIAAACSDPRMCGKATNVWQCCLTNSGRTVWVGAIQR